MSDSFHFLSFGEATEVSRTVNPCVPLDHFVGIDLPPLMWFSVSQAFPTPLLTRKNECLCCNYWLKKNLTLLFDDKRNLFGTLPFHRYLLMQPFLHF